MESVRLPIDVVAGTDPPIFRWRQTVDTPSGRQVVDHEGSLGVVVEVAVVRIISIAKQLLHDNAVLRGEVDGLCKRLEAVSHIEESTELATRGLKQGVSTDVKQEPKHIIPKKGR
jgi:hypothetical protein